jgi:anti-sigma regulatory factor (Ser/Thr protein kinase)
VLQRVLPATPASVRLARMTARVACRAWRAPELEEPAALVASELVTTVVRHATGGVVTVRVRMTPRRLRIEVHDPSGQVPDDVETGTPDADAESVVEAESARWGRERAHPGVLLWAELPLG